MDEIRAREKFAGAIIGDNLLSPATIIRRPGGISLKAQKKKRLRPRGECAPEPPVMRNTDATVYGKDMRGALSSSGTPNIGCMLQRHDAMRPAVDGGAAPLLCQSGAPLPPFQSFIPWP